MSEELLWGSTGRITGPLRAGFKYFITRTMVFSKDDMLENHTEVVFAIAQAKRYLHSVYNETDLTTMINSVHFPIKITIAVS